MSGDASTDGPEIASEEGSVDADEQAGDNGSADDEASATGPETGWTTASRDECGSFLGCDDTPSSLMMCEFWAQNCPDGEKCTPALSAPQTGPWDTNVCVQAGTSTIGEACTSVDGHPWADTCDASSICWDIDPDTGIGTCVGYCTGTELSAKCPENSGPTTRCQRIVEGVAYLCLADCNPLLAGECSYGKNCVPNLPGEELEGFICFPPAALGTGGEACACANCCAAGHMCVAAEDYGPGCAFDACCTEYCDVSDSSFVCQGPDQVCVPLFDPNTPEVGNVGRCVVP